MGDLEQPHSGRADTIEAVAVFAKSLSCPVRLEVFLALTAGPVCVSDLATRLELDSTLVSHHLGLLRDARLVDSVQSGHYHIYSLTPVVRVSGEDGCLVLSLRAGEGELRLSVPRGAAPPGAQIEIKPPRSDSAVTDDRRSA